MIPPPQERKQPTAEPMEKLPLALQHLEDAIEETRRLTHVFVKKFKYFDDTERTEFVTQIWEKFSDVSHRILSLAHNRGEEDDLKESLRFLVRKFHRNKAGEFDYGKFLSGIHQGLSVLQGWLEQQGLLLTMQPIPSDFSAQVIEQVQDESTETAHNEMRKIIEKDKAAKLKKLKKLSASGQLTPEKIAMLSEGEQKALQRFQGETEAQDLAEMMQFEQQEAERDS
jgi:hypothetical protein